MVRVNIGVIMSDLNNNILVHIPHSKTKIPVEFMGLFSISDQDIKNELIKMTDLYTDELFASKYDTVIFPFSRLICDVERFRDDSAEIMSKKGMGICYTSTSNQTPLKTVTEEHRSFIMQKYYEPHHNKIFNIVKQKLECYGSCLIIDAHSFASEPLPYEYQQDSHRPDICIGSDEYHTPVWVSKYCLDYFKTLGYKVNINTPFSGTIIPMQFYQKEPAVYSIMIEVNKKLYLNESNGNKNDKFYQTQHNIELFLESLSNFCETAGKNL